MKEGKLIEELKEKAVFRVQDVQRILNSSRNYSKLVLNRLIKREEIKRIKKNAYTVQDDIFVISSNIIYPSYISFWSASGYKGYTEQVLNTIQIATTKKIKKTSFLNHRIKFIKINYFFGYEKIKTNFGDIFLATDEKLIIDSLTHQKEMGNFDEIREIIKNSKISVTKIIEYLKRINSQTLIKRVGYLLEKIKKIDISKEFNLDKNYVLLNKISKKYKRLNTKWRIKI